LFPNFLSLSSEQLHISHLPSAFDAARPRLPAAGREGRGGGGATERESEREKEREREREKQTERETEREMDNERERERWTTRMDNEREREMDNERERERERERYYEIWNLVDWAVLVCVECLFLRTPGSGPTSRWG